MLCCFGMEGQEERGIVWVVFEFQGPMETTDSGLLIMWKGARVVQWRGLLIMRTGYIEGLMAL